MARRRGLGAMFSFLMSPLNLISLFTRRTDSGGGLFGFGRKRGGGRRGVASTFSAMTPAVFDFTTPEYKTLYRATAKAFQNKAIEIYDLQQRAPRIYITSVHMGDGVLSFKAGPGYNANKLNFRFRSQPDKPKETTGRKKQPIFYKIRKDQPRVGRRHFIWRKLIRYRPKGSKRSFRTAFGPSDVGIYDTPEIINPAAAAIEVAYYKMAEKAAARWARQIEQSM